MASIVKLPNGKQQVRYRDADNVQRAENFTRLVDARARRREVESSLASASFVDPRAGKISVREYASQWESTLIHRSGTARIVDNALRLHLLPALGNRKMSTVRRSDIQALIKQLSEQLAPGTVRNIADQTARLFASAVDDRVIAETPCRKITLPVLPDGEVVAPTPARVFELASAVPTRYRAMVVLLAGTGLRIGEGLGLKIDDVNFLRRELRVDRQRLQDGSVAPPKTARSVRTVPLGDVVTRALAAHLAVFGDGSEWMFSTSMGEPLGYPAWRSVWTSAQRPEKSVVMALACRKCLSKIDVPCRNSSGAQAARPHAARVADANEGTEPVDTHALRHFYASALISGGASVKQVSMVLGHSSAVVTLKVYSHLWPGDDDRTRALVDVALDGLRVA